MSWEDGRCHLSAISRDGAVYGDLRFRSRNCPYRYSVWGGLIAMGSSSGIDVYRIVPPHKVYLPFVMRGQ